MAIENSEQVNNGAEIAKNATTTGAKAAGKGAAKAGKKAWSILPPKAKLAVILIAVFFVIIAILVGGTASSSFKDTIRPNAINEDSTYNYPKNEEDAEKSIYDIEIAKDNTIKLIEVIHKAKQKDYENLNASVEAEIKRKAHQAQYSNLENVDVELSLQMAKREMSETSRLCYGGVAVDSSTTVSEAVQWAVDFANNNNDYGYKVWEDGNDDTKKCPLCNPGSGKGWNCIGFISAAYYHGGKLLNIKCKCNGLATGSESTGTLEGTDEEMLSKWRKRNGKDWDLITNSGEKTGANLKESDLKPGDVLVAYRKSDGVSHHLMLYVGDGKIAECVQSSSTANDIRVKSYKKKCAGYKKRDIFITRAFRYTKSEASAAGGAVAENIAKTAESFSWPSRPMKKYLKRKGGRSVDAMHRAALKYYDGKIEEADCNEFVRTVLSAALGRKVKCSLSFYGNHKREEDIKKELSPLGFTLFDWDGNESSLRRGDIVFYIKTGGYHTYVYLGKNGKASVAEAQYHKGTYGHLTSFRSGTKPGLKNKSKCMVIRHSSSMNVANPTGTTTAGDGQTMTAYDDIKILGTIPKTQGRIERLARGGSHTFQSYCYNSGYFYMMRPKKGNRGSDGYIYKYQQDTMKAVKITKDNPIGHGNGCAYCTADNKIYSVTVSGVRDNTVACVINPETLTVESTAPLEHGSSTIAYDRVTKRFITGSGASSGDADAKGHLYIYESDLKTKAGVKTITKLRWKHPGDMCAYNGVIYCCTYIVNDENYVDMYSEDTGKYLGSYACPHEEIEGVDIDDNGEMILLFKGKKGEDNYGYIQYTGITVGSAGSFMSSAVSKLDMDLLSAYNLSISNTAMYMDREGIEKGYGDDWWNEKAYSDISGKKLKLYWFGKNRGLINYEKDLDSKVDALIKGDARSDTSKHFYKITIGTATETVSSFDEDGNEVEKKIVPVTIKEAEVEDMMGPVFGLEPTEYYINSRTRKAAERYQAVLDGEDTDDTSKTVPKGTATNLEATYSLSDNTGKLLFGDLVVVQNPDFDVETDMAFGLSIVGTEGQQKILSYIQRNFPPGKANPYKNGWAHKCLAWCAKVYNGAGFAACATGKGTCCASAHRDAYAKKTGEIPPGAFIYSSPSKYKSGVKCGCGRNAGHIAIYIGDGKIAGSQPPYILTLEQWNKTYGYGGWSFGGNKF